MKTRTFSALTSILTAAALWMGSVNSVQATIYLNAANATYVVPTSYSNGTDQGSNLSASEFEQYLQVEKGITTSIESILYKYTRSGASEAGSQIPDSYKTTPINAVAPLQYKIEYMGAPNPVADATFLMAKGPNGYATLVWALQNWDGKEPIVFTNDGFVKYKTSGLVYQNFSHFQIFGVVDSVVPESSTVFAAAMMLLPFGYATARSLRTRKQ